MTAATSRGARRIRSAILACTLLAAVAACDRADHRLPELAGGDAERGRTLIKPYGCSSCHTIGGVPGADALVGPPLNGIASRMYIGGVARNTPLNMVHWIENPKQFDPKTAMPNVGVSHRDAVDIASYLYTLK